MGEGELNPEQRFDSVYSKWYQARNGFLPFNWKFRLIQTKTGVDVLKWHNFVSVQGMLANYMYGVLKLQFSLQQYLYLIQKPCLTSTIELFIPLEP